MVAIALAMLASISLAERAMLLAARLAPLAGLVAVESIAAAVVLGVATWTRWRLARSNAIRILVLASFGALAVRVLRAPIKTLVTAATMPVKPTICHFARCLTGCSIWVLAQASQNIACTTEVGFAFPCRNLTSTLSHCWCGPAGPVRVRSIKHLVTVWVRCWALFVSIVIGVGVVI
jgi:hypothetical protein